ncbi:hypothetical protein [Rhizobium sp. SYY.PMSO]|uniref:hypothetical protein n=1 Tax=Rhizobium sp. SYY.PMSO TaxID=3382192 RepID=UPI0039901CE9
MVTVFCVLRVGGDYRPQHVIRLQQQVLEHLTDADFRCLSDVPIDGISTVPLKFGWPGWWAKMELFRPSIKGPVLFLDLDTSIVGSIGDIAAVDRLTIMRDVYRPLGLQSSMMFLTEAERERVWLEWIERPAQWMTVYRNGGDQAFLERFWLDRADRWQDVLPGQIVSYKAHVRKAVRKDREIGNGTIPEGARVVIFHGKPRPWDIGW